MRTGHAGIALIKSFEGLRLKAYQRGKDRVTIGWGHTRGVTLDQVITTADAERFLIEDLEMCERDVNAWLKVPTTQNQFDAMVSFVFNLGGAVLARSRKGGLLGKLNAGDVQGAAAEFLRYKYAQGQVEPGLVRRRAAERALFLAPDGTVPALT